ncbi:hypothetical protein B7463_g10510, partial [Scytalidium lignicola]
MSAPTQLASKINACETVCETPELLIHVLGFLGQGDLLRLQRVSRRWNTLINTTPRLQSAIFDSNIGVTQYAVSDAMQYPSSTPRLNSFVIDRLHWSPNLDIEQVNDIRFAGVQSSQSLRMMAYQNASWRKELLSWPPVRELTVIHGTITAEEPSLQDLVLVSDIDSASVQRFEVGRGHERAAPLVLDTRSFPHNHGNTSTGIKVIDVLYGLHLHYIENRTTLGYYMNVTLDSSDVEEIMGSFCTYKSRLFLDVTFMRY